jgi:Eco57I restriction-modification methylase
LSHNLHGIDIDLRATQIAALTLWLRAQRAYQEMEIKGADRPKITRSNIVCAEPMPGEQGLLEEFVTGLQPTVLGQLVRAVFARMRLAGEAGSLLKIAEDIADTVAEAKQQWLSRPKAEQLVLWPEERRPQAAQLGLFDVSGITDEDFWYEAEARVLDTLHAYARHAANGTELQRQLFADDAIHGFAFIDVCRKRFDVVVMNPPFGEASKPSKPYIENSYPRTKNDVYAAFVERGLHLLARGGMLGAITSRTGFFLSSFQKWREEVLLQEAKPTVFADLGYGVLDTAMVETAAYCLEAVGRNSAL